MPAGTRLLDSEKKALCPPAVADGAVFLRGCVVARGFVLPYPTDTGDVPVFFTTSNNAPSNCLMTTPDSPWHPEALNNLSVHPTTALRISCFTELFGEMLNLRCRIHR